MEGKWDFIEKKIPKEKREARRKEVLTIFSKMLDELEKLSKDPRASERQRALLRDQISNLEEVKRRTEKEYEETERRISESEG